MQEAYATYGDGEREAGDFFGLADALLRVAGFELGIQLWLAVEADLEHGGIGGGRFDAVCRNPLP